jgi:hypothetical protein
MTFSRDSMAANKPITPVHNQAINFVDEHLNELTQIESYLSRSGEKLRRLMKEGSASRGNSLNNTKQSA